MSTDPCALGQPDCVLGMSLHNGTECRMTAHDWERTDRVDRVVVDPDGWRHPGAPGPDVAITFDEYQRMAGPSTTAPKSHRGPSFFALMAGQWERREAQKAAIQAHAARYGFLPCPHGIEFHGCEDGPQAPATPPGYHRLDAEPERVFVVEGTALLDLLSAAAHAAANCREFRVGFDTALRTRIGGGQWSAAMGEEER